MTLGIDRRLHVVADNSGAFALARHGTRVWVGQGDLAIGAGLHLLLQALHAAHLLLQRRNAILQSNRLAHRARRFLAVHPIELLQVLIDTLLDQLHPHLHLPAREVPIPMIDRLELAAVDCHDCLREHPESPAQHDELAAHAADRYTVVGTKIRQRFEVWSQATRQPHKLQITICFLFEPSTGLDAVQVPVQINLQHR